MYDEMPARDDVNLQATKRRRLNSDNTIRPPVQTQTEALVEEHDQQSIRRPPRSPAHVFGSFKCSSEQLAVVREIEAQIGFKFKDHSICIRALDLRRPWYDGSRASSSQLLAQWGDEVADWIMREHMRPHQTHSCTYCLN